MNNIEELLVADIEELSGRSIALDDKPMEVLDSLGLQGLLARWPLPETAFPTLWDLETVQSLAVYLQSAERHWVGADVVDAVALQPTGSAPPFFCAPSVADNPFGLLPLSRSMGPEQPFYALRNSLAIADRSVHTVSDLAEKYARAMRRIQPDGPYYLGGYCFGGSVAFETAHKLRASGAEVALLVLLDASTPGYPSLLRHWKLYLAALRYHLFSRWNRDEWARGVKGDFLSFCALIDRLARGAVERYLKRIRPRLLPSQQTVVEANRQASRLYRPAGYSGEIILLNAKERLPHNGSPLDRRHGWFELADGGVREYMVKGNHETMITEPYVAETAACLKTLIEHPSAASRAKCNLSSSNWIVQRPAFASRTSRSVHP